MHHDMDHAPLQQSFCTSMHPPLPLSLSLSLSLSLCAPQHGNVIHSVDLRQKSPWHVLPV